MYKGGSVVKELLFRGTGSDRYNWFSATRLITSSWVDIKSQPKNFFSLHGHCADGASYTCRSFFINREYGDCKRDNGWLMITGTSWCDWEGGVLRYRQIMYSKGNSYAMWSSKGELNTPKNDKGASKPVARHFNLPNHATLNMTNCSHSLHQGDTESRKTIEQVFILQLGSLNPHGINERLSLTN